MLPKVGRSGQTRYIWSDSALGLAYVLELLVAEDLAERRLVEVLSHAAITEPGLFLYYPQGAGRDAKLRVFVETARDLRSRFQD